MERMKILQCPSFPKKLGLSLGTLLSGLYCIFGIISHNDCRGSVGCSLMLAFIWITVPIVWILFFFFGLSVASIIMFMQKKSDSEYPRFIASISYGVVLLAFIIYGIIWFMSLAPGLK